MLRSAPRLSVWSALLVAASCSLDQTGTAGPGRIGIGTLDASAHASGETSRLDAQAAAEPPALYCMGLAQRFEPRAPTVFVLVDRSSTMFEQDFWEPLKAGVLAAVERLAPDVRFGFAAYTGERDGLCPELSVIARSALGDAATIRQAYQRIGAPPYKGETPTSLALAEVAQLLASDPQRSAKSILLFTDGEPDLCGDTNLLCARDATIAAAQQAHARGIDTFWFALGDQLDREHLEDLANAGSGEPVFDRQQGASLEHCPAQGSYAAAGGSARFYQPDPENFEATSELLASVIASLRSCVFELQGGLQIELEAGARGLVKLDGAALLYGDPNGFRLNGPSELELVGASCERLRLPDARVQIEFPCEDLRAP